MSCKLEDQLSEYALGTLAPDQIAAVDAHLAECKACARALAAIDETLALLPLGLPAQAPPAALRERLLASIAGESRFERFTARMAAMMDLTQQKVRELLALLDDDAAWTAGPATARIIHLPHGPAVAGANVGFVRLAAGETFPEHEHRGTEHALLLQGSFRDSEGNVKVAGQAHLMREGTAHSFVALDGPDLIFLVVLYGDLVMRGGSKYVL